MNLGTVQAGMDGPCPGETQLDVLIDKYAGRFMPAEQALEFQALCQAEGVDAVALAQEAGIFFGISVQLHNQMVAKVE
jgi:hypothetical protein